MLAEHADVRRPVRLLVLGAGNRGNVYGAWGLRHPERAVVAGVVEPDRARRDAFAGQHGIPPGVRFDHWEQAVDLFDRVDAVIVALPDRLHVEPTVAALERGRHVLLEKPMGATPDDLARIAAAEAASPGAVTVCHVLRYTPFYMRLRQILDDGRIGEVQTIQYTENIGYWHFAHSYVRGNWHNELASSPMILAKACHDLDILRWLVGRPALRVSSFGSLTHFRAENAPEGATDRCIDGCPAAAGCPYDAVRLYVEQLAGWDGHPISVVTRDPSIDGRRHALRTTDYGRCVYKMDNDVVDHQVVNIEFAGGVTAALTATGFTRENTRTMKFMGTHGEIRGQLDRGELEVRQFVPVDRGSDVLPVQVERVSAALPVGSPARPAFLEASWTGHSGGDDGLMDAFVSWLAAAVDEQAPPKAPVTSMTQSLESHIMAFAAERSRREGVTVDMATETQRLLALSSGSAAGSPS